MNERPMRAKSTRGRVDLTANETRTPLNWLSDNKRLDDMNINFKFRRIYHNKNLLQLRKTIWLSVEPPLDNDSNKYFHTDAKQEYI